MEVGDRRDSVAHGRFARRGCVRRRHLSMSGENRRYILGVSRPCGSQCEGAVLRGRCGSGVTFVVGITCLRRLEASYLVLFACLLQRCSSRRRSWLLRRCSVRCSSSRAALRRLRRRRRRRRAQRRAEEEEDRRRDARRAQRHVAVAGAALPQGMRPLCSYHYYCCDYYYYCCD